MKYKKIKPTKNISNEVYDADSLIDWINESNSLAEYVSMEFESMNIDDLGASLENASQCLDAIVEMLENGTLVLKK
ncbi:hypothetical protein [Streptococcus catagoni]|uniref:hypothetical protein n=1 Tax=Streptococcus catagoni TaxID=2654874 RepID=UPI00140C114E|nr:hypothetical protein [Streptococcus catagoni]